MSELYPVKKSGSVWMVAHDSSQSVSRELAERAMLKLNLDPSDWRTRDALIDELFPVVNGALNYVAQLDGLAV